MTSEFQTRETVIKALRSLKAAGISPSDIDVYSDEPLELPRSALPRRSNMSLAVVSGAVLFLISVVSFVYFAQHNYPLITGGMPIFSVWATGVVFYELTLLGSILTAAIWFIYESGLCRKKDPAPAFTPGSICLRIKCPSDRESAIRTLLESAGGKAN